MTVAMRVLAFLLLLLAAPAWAGTLDLAGRFEQGGLIRGRTEPGTQILLGGAPVRVSPEGLFVFGFGRDHGPAAVLEAVYPDGSRERRDLTVAKRQYKLQRIDGLPSKMVTPPPGVLQRIRRENARIAEIRTHDTPAVWFAGTWAWPVTGPISGVFGSQRVLNGKQRRPHFGLDIAAPAGTPVTAPTDAVVALAENDLYYTGGTVILDHGHGVTSVYSHMSAVTVKPGQRVRQGDKIGEVGSTGRVTGAHLDWRINWFKERIDPAFLVPPMPKN